jgi:two-component system chemotaxis sensor kinase CheA
MAVDLKQFRGAFFEEAGEHLAEMERLLLELDPANPDAEGVNAIFRAAHSIKGGANMFALGEIAGVTHEMETVLDAARKGKLRLTGPIVDALLGGCDFVRDAVAKARADKAADAARAAQITADLRNLAAPDAPKPRARIELVWPARAKREAKKIRKLVADVARLVRLQPAELEELQAALTAHGKAEVVLPEGSDAGRIRESLAFVLPEDCIRIAAAEGDAFGFFEENLPKARQATQPAAAESPAPASAPVENVSIRVNAEKIDRLINLTGELMIGYSMVRSGIGAAGGSDHLGMALATVERNIRELQEAALSIRMIPIAGVFARFPRLVHDLSAQLGKRAELRVEGESTELDRGLVEKLVDPLTHLIRNSLDHGIEAPQAREAAGKPARGTVWLRASHESGSVVIEVADDGAGLSREKILKRAAEQGLRADDGMSDAAVWDLIFAPGFSTATAVSDVSGRGVGMDIVRRNVRELGGHVEISSQAGKGTRTLVRLPLTLAIMDGDLKSIANDSLVLNLRGEIVPVLSLAKALGIEHKCKAGEEVLVVVENGGRRAALAADALLGQQQIVVKNLEGNFGKVSGVAGATILGNGAVSLILDIPELMRVALGNERLALAA